MTSDGFAAPNFPIGGGPPSNLGNPQFPNLPVIEATHDLGLFTGGGVPFFDPQSGMSAPERQAWQRRIMHCFQATQRQDPLFGSGQFNQLGSGWFNIVNQVSQSPQIRALSKTAAACSAALGVPATSVMSLYGRLQGQIGPLSSSSTNSAEVQAIQAKGARILATCWAKVINETTSLLSARRSTYLAQTATASAGAPVPPAEPASTRPARSGTRSPRRRSSTPAPPRPPAHHAPAAAYLDRHAPGASANPVGSARRS